MEERGKVEWNQKNEMKGETLKTWEGKGMEQNGRWGRNGRNAMEEMETRKECHGRNGNQEGRTWKE